MSLKNVIKQMEDAKRKESLDSLKNQVVTFDTWYYMREAKIPSKHHRDIIWSFFNSLKLTKNETVRTYDEALQRYGIKID